VTLRRRKKKKEEQEEEDTMPSSAEFKFHIGYTRDSRIIKLFHRSLLKEDLDIEKKEETERTRTTRKPSRSVAPFCNLQHFCNCRSL
jgi:hypothetical protein